MATLAITFNDGSGITVPDTCYDFNAHGTTLITWQSREVREDFSRTPGHRLVTKKFHKVIRPLANIKEIEFKDET